MRFNVPYSLRSVRRSQRFEPRPRAIDCRDTQSPNLTTGLSVSYVSIRAAYRNWCYYRKSYHIAFGTATGNSSLTAASARGAAIGPRLVATRSPWETPVYFDARQQRRDSHKFTGDPPRPMRHTGLNLVAGGGPVPPRRSRSAAYKFDIKPCYSVEGVLPADPPRTSKATASRPSCWFTLRV